ncbi:MAG: Mrp/NBP35 family ATP-binding protein [Alphaproteobacteria bacterium]|nr:Mrp/NBP35 family ATP-binding protein [Alphaproteobacteria bacterium]
MNSDTDAQLIKVVEAELATIIDPQSGQDLITQNLVSAVVAKQGIVGITLTVTPSAVPRLEPICREIEQRIRKFKGVIAVTAVMTAERKAPPSHSRHEGQPQAAKPVLAPGIKRMIAVASGKGGVGKSTTAVNLALALAALGQRVGLLDADVYGPSTPRLMGLAGKPEVKNGKLQPMVNFGIACMSMGFLVPEDTAMVWRGPMVAGALEQMLRDVNWGELDILVIDMPPGTGDAQLTLAQRVALAGAVIVSTPQDIALLDARKAVAMFRKVAVPILGVIENMSYYLCPQCGHRAEIFSHGGARHDAEKMTVTFLGEIPLVENIRETSDRGLPIVLAEPNSSGAIAFTAAAEAVLVQLLTTAPPTAPRIVQ